MFAESVPFPAAFVAGLLSFFSPCILPLIPAYFSFFTGCSLETLTDEKHRQIRSHVVWSTLSYVAGFSLVFILLGASASFLGSLLQLQKNVFRVAGGLVVIILGLHVSGLFRIPFLEFERRLKVDKKPLHFLGAFFVGMAFGLGWSPCIGPLLGSILVLAGSQETIGRGMALLGVYSAGLAIPFIILSFFIHLVTRFIRKAAGVIKYVNAVAGVLLITTGLLLVFDKLDLLTVSF